MKFRVAVVEVVVCQLLAPVASLHQVLVVQVHMLKHILHQDFLACQLQSVQLVLLAHPEVEMVAREAPQALGH
ncbi:TPA: hypothetical protein ROA93_001913 [Escherichia coli]|nr:hypothetical protein [Escherichia coli]